MDNRQRVIVDVEVTEPNLHEEGQVAGQMLERTQLRLGVVAATVAGDTAYGYGAAVRRIWGAGVTPHVPALSQGQWNAAGIFGKEDFRYDREADELICPAGKRLHKRTEHARNRQSEYAARVTDCRGCVLKPHCTRTRYRVAHRHWDQDYLDRAAALRETAGYRLSQRCRKRIEHLYAEAKEQLGLRRARRRGRHPADLGETLLPHRRRRCVPGLAGHGARRQPDGPPPRGEHSGHHLPIDHLPRPSCQKNNLHDAPVNRAQPVPPEPPA